MKWTGDVEIYNWTEGFWWARGGVTCEGPLSRSLSRTTPSALRHDRQSLTGREKEEKI